MPDLSGFDPNELEALLDQMQETGGGSDEDEPTGVEKQEAPKHDEKTAQLEEMVRSLQAEATAQKRENAQTMGLVSQLMEQLRGAKEGAAPVQVDPDASPEDKRAALEFALKHSPDLITKILEPDFKKMAAAQMKTFESSFEKKSQIRDLGNLLSSSVLGTYGEEIQKPDSALIRKAAQMKRQIAGILDKDVVGSDLHDQLAIAMAAAASPDEVAKIHGSKQKAAEAARQEAMERLANLFGSRGEQYTRNEPEITDDDREIAEAWEADLDDEETRKEILARKRRTQDTFVAQNKVMG